MADEFRGTSIRHHGILILEVYPDRVKFLMMNPRLFSKYVNIELIG